MNTDTDHSASASDLSNQMATTVLQTLDSVELRNSDRFLGNVAKIVGDIAAKGARGTSDIKALEDTFAIYHEAILKQSISLLAWVVDAHGDEPRHEVMRAVETALDSCRQYALSIANKRWADGVARPLARASEGGERLTKDDLTHTIKQLEARRAASYIWARKELYDTVNELLYERELHRANVTSAQASQRAADASEISAQAGSQSADYAKSVRNMTKWMVAATIIIAGSGVAQVFGLWRQPAPTEIRLIVEPGLPCMSALFNCGQRFLLMPDATGTLPQRKP